MTDDLGHATPCSTHVRGVVGDCHGGTIVLQSPVRVTGPSQATVVLGHPHRLYLDSLVRLFDETGSLQLVACVTTEEQLVECVGRLQPEVAIFEPFGRHPEGIAVLKRLRSACETTRALVILKTAELPELLDTLQAGASGYFSHDTTAEDIIRAVQVTRRGELWVKRGMMQQLLLMGRAANELRSRAAAEPSPTRGEARCELSQRERQVATLVVAGLCNKRIATALRITESTVKAHLVSIFRRLNIQNRTQLARYVEAMGLTFHAEMIASD